MDRKPHKLGRVLLCFGLAATTAIAQEAAQLREEAWLSEGGRLEALASEPAVFDADLVRMIEQQPGLLDHMGSGNWKDRVRVGSMLFKTPFLFGGQAAKAGLSCHSCHVNGRDNPHFQFPGVSGDPGTADISHSFFSKNLGNAEFDPVPIPDLAIPGKIDHSAQSRELEQFIRTIVVDEFSGDEPGEYTVGALATYVRAVALTAGSNDLKRTDRSISRDLDVVHAMVEQARYRLVDRPEDSYRLSRLLLAGARHRLALVHERLVEADQAAHRLRLERASRALGEVQNRISEGMANHAIASIALTGWLQSFADRAELEAQHATSLYNRERLEQHLADAE
ncbi:MAG: hypothetical protein QNJ15_10100 [Erythrobacter sp.]|nr:hypothetical protein [Erythrobacter sp.]